MDQPWMQTASGRAWPLISPQPCHVHWDDVAEHLAKTNRFNGATLNVTYSVAQHCCHVANSLPVAMRLYGLLHDAHEAFTSDITRPMKQALQVFGAGDALKRAEEAYDRAIFAAAGLEYPMPYAIAAYVKLADLKMLATERRDLMADCAEPWMELPDPFPTPIKPWPWAKAHHEFMTRLKRWLPYHAKEL